MKRFLMLLICTVTYQVFAQNTEIDSVIVTPKEVFQLSDTIIQPATKKELFTHDDLKLMDSLLVEAKFKSPLYDSIQYVINDKDIIGNVEQIVSPDLLKQRLSEINSTTPFHLAYNPALEKVINNYIKYRKKYYPAVMARAQYYFPMFEQYLDQYNIPLEMKYLAIVESTLNPKAKSRVGATGLWQFMYGTGRQFKLSINSYVDERQDPEKSTIAACKYLNNLYDIFGDWDLALAAYNSGPGNVLKAIKRSGGHRNYWNIRPFLPRETAGYVPAFYATMYIFKYADELGIYPEAPQIFNFQTDTIHVKRTISFDHISEKTGVDEKIISFLNPMYKLDVIPYVNKKNFTVRLPRNKTFDFIDKEHEIYALAEYDDSKREQPLPKYFEMDKRIRYKVKSGDYLGKIANKFGVTVSKIKRWNNMKNTNLKIGQRLYIYPRRM
ncbi:lytic transglycosylase domain-containing protein [Tenacibaculum sp. IB213877]|uniref:lytic transglycosylase domain-containing protein n=1 Tax=Tenacibaculum sp. IB213877 TaxID=3097351 RepID=UPI002A5A70C3|nr:transglycosylase SLT domain-containing protein [Tenacibaculum sp. IB213877]MDY0780568.1 transglycosylase SLT domain-containing protein [Tenacibaculum sp. IB213877]